MRQRAFDTLAALALCLLAHCGWVKAQTSPSPVSATRLWITALEKGHPVKDLRKEELQLWIGQQPIEISSLSPSPPEHQLLGLLIDKSGSERSPSAFPTRLLSCFLRQTLGPGDPAFIVGFSGVPYLDAAPTDDLGKLNLALERVASLRTYGSTALYDAIEASCNPAEGSDGFHHVLVVITDGLDNASRHRLDQVEEVLRRTGVRLHFVDTVSLDDLLTGAARFPAREAGYKLREVARATGGTLSVGARSTQLEPALGALSQILHAQYALDFQSAGTTPGTKPLRVKVKCSRQGVQITAPRDY
jgi:VWFA-related protein